MAAIVNWDVDVRVNDLVGEMSAEVHVFALLEHGLKKPEQGWAVRGWILGVHHDCFRSGG
jgi:hypothetical protein